MIDVVRARKNKGKLLVEFIPFGGKSMNIYDWDTGKTKHDSQKVTLRNTSK